MSFGLLVHAAALAVPTETIVVTGERTARRLADTASSVVVVDAEREQRNGIDRTDEMLGGLANVTLGSEGLGAAVRGQDTTGPLTDLAAFLGGSRQRISLSIDGREADYYEYVFGATPLWDVRQVEIFRSPQTLTQGRHSIGGAIFVSTREPEDEWGGRVRIGGGSLERRSVAAMVTGPLGGEQLSFRLSGEVRDSAPPTLWVTPIDGVANGVDRHRMIRAKLRARPRLIPGGVFDASFTRSLSLSPQIFGVTPPYEERVDRRGTYGIFKVRVSGATARWQQQFSGQTTASLLVTATKGHKERFSLPHLGNADIVTADRSAELHVERSWQGGKLLAGAHRLASKLDQSIDVSALIGNGKFRDRQSSTGLFAEIEQRLSDRWLIDAGLRRQWDRQSRSGGFGINLPDFRQDFVMSHGSWLPKASLSYELSPNSTMGVMVLRASNPGGSTIKFLPDQQDRFGPESLWDAEVFGRFQLAGGKASLQFNGFRYWMENMQRNRLRLVTLSNGRSTIFSEIRNLGSGRSAGMEIEGRWRLDPHWTLSGGLGLLSTRITEASPAVPELQGREFARSPRLSGVAGVEWSDRGWHASLRAHYSSAYFSDDQNVGSRKVTPAHDFSASVERQWHQTTFNAYVKNLTDRLDLTYRFATSLATVNRPREIGIVVTQTY